MDESRLTVLLEKITRPDFRILRAVPSLNQRGVSSYEIFHDAYAPAILDWRGRYEREKESAEAEQRAREEKQRAEEKARAEERAIAAVRLRRMAMAFLGLLTLIAAIFLIKELMRTRKEAELSKDQAASARISRQIARKAADANRHLLSRAYGGNFEIAIRNLQEDLSNYQKHKNSVGELVTLNNLAGLFAREGLSYQDNGNYERGMNDFRQALDYYQRAMTILDSLRENFPDSATTLNDMGLVYVYQGKYADAVPLIKRAVEIREDSLGSNNLSVAEVLGNLAECYKSLGKYDEAEPLYERALKIREELLPPDDPDRAQSLKYLGVLYSEQSRYAEAKDRLNEAKRIWEISPEIYQKRLDLISNYFAIIYRKEGKYEDAKQHINKALKSSRGLDAAYYQRNLALVYYDQEDSARAEPLLKEASAFLEKGLGPEHPDVAFAIGNLGSLYYKQNKYTEAEKLLNRAITVLNIATPDHPDLADLLENYVALLRMTNRSDQAIKYEEQAKQIRDKQAKK